MESVPETEPPINTSDPSEEPLSWKLPRQHITSQSQSILFNRIPAEIRDKIFEYACTSEERHDFPVRRSALSHRPGYEHYKHTWTELLRTCRRIYLETYLLPAAVNEHVFWCWDGPDPALNGSGLYNFETAYDYMYFTCQLKLKTRQQRNAVRELHFFTQQFWLEKGGYGIGLSRDQTQWWMAASILSSQCTPKKIKFTIRHRDWWSWSEHPSTDERLAIHPFRSDRAMWRDMDLPATPEAEAPDAWGYQLKNFEGLQELEMEFETIKSKSDHLDAVVQHALAWKFDMGDGRVLKTDGLPVVQSTWLGLGDEHIHHPAISEEEEQRNLQANMAAMERLHKETQMAEDAAQRAQYQDSVREREGSESRRIGRGEVEDFAEWIREHNHLPATVADSFVETIHRQEYYVVSVRWKARTQ